MMGQRTEIPIPMQNGATASSPSAWTFNPSSTQIPKTADSTLFFFSSRSQRQLPFNLSSGAAPTDMAKAHFNQRANFPVSAATSNIRATLWPRWCPAPRPVSRRARSVCPASLATLPLQLPRHKWPASIPKRFKSTKAQSEEDKNHANVPAASDTESQPSLPTAGQPKCGARIASITMRVVWPEGNE